VMKTLILNNWAAKVASLVLASVLWFLIRKNIEEGQTPEPLSPMVIAPTDANQSGH
jgi:hypothetical protein